MVIKAIRVTSQTDHPGRKGDSPGYYPGLSLKIFVRTLTNRSSIGTNFVCFDRIWILVFGHWTGFSIQ